MFKKILVTIMTGCFAYVWAHCVEINNIDNDILNECQRRSCTGFANDIKITDDYIPHSIPEIDASLQVQNHAFCAFSAIYQGNPGIMIYETSDGGYTWTWFGGIYNTVGNTLILGSITVTLNAVCICYTEDTWPERVETYSKPKTGGTGSFHQFSQNPASQCRMSKRGNNDVIDIIFIYSYGSSIEENCAIYYNSSDGGLTWSNEHSFSIDQGHLLPDVYHYPYSNNIYLVWFAWSMDALMFTKSTDGGNSFTSQIISNTPYANYPKIARSPAHIVILYDDDPPQCVWSNNEGSSWYQFTLPLSNIASGMDRFAICYGSFMFRAVADDNGNMKYKTAAVPTDFASTWTRINDVNYSAEEPCVCYIASNAGLTAWSDNRESSFKIFCDNESWEPGVKEDNFGTASPQINSLGQNYPNPFVFETSIHYTIFQETNVQLQVYDVSGKQVAIFVNKIQKPGNHKVTWDIRNITQKQLPNGIYFYQIKAESFTETKKMIVLR